MNTAIDISTIKTLFKHEMQAVNNLAALTKIKSDFLGKKGYLREISKDLSQLDLEARKQIGQQSNLLKKEIQEVLNLKQAEIEQKQWEETIAKQWFDFSLCDHYLEHKQVTGALHPVTIVQRELESIFLHMGFQVLDGPHIEDDYHNFEALNIPPNHPARDMQDTFWFSDMKHLLRTHTSPIQIRGMESKNSPPFSFIAPGKAFRCEATDASHESVFHQMEGMMVDKNISVSHLIYFMKKILSEIFQQEVRIRLRPGYFPFVEPGFELDILCLVCKGKGCSICKGTAWLELLPCGMIHPTVLEHGGINPKEYRGFAFGLGLDRLVMMRYQIDDIRHIHSNNLAFLQQFRSY